MNITKFSTTKIWSHTVYNGNIIDIFVLKKTRYFFVLFKD